MKHFSAINKKQAWKGMTELKKGRARDQLLNYFEARVNMGELNYISKQNNARQKQDIINCIIRS